MHTIRCGGRLAGGCLPGGEGVCLGGVSAQGGSCLGGYTPPCEQNDRQDRCKNITFPQPRLRAVTKLFFPRGGGAGGGGLGRAPRRCLVRNVSICLVVWSRNNAKGTLQFFFFYLLVVVPCTCPFLSIFNNWLFFTPVSNYHLN